MPSYTTRVELHEATWSDYSKLHDAMAKEGFFTTITSSDGTIYELPPAEYNYVGEENRAEILEKAKRAASTVKKGFGVLVTESAGRSWQGLKVLRRRAVG